MENHSRHQQKPGLYPQLLNISDCFQTFLSQPWRYIFLTSFFHLTTLIYFIVTIKQSNVISQVITIASYVLISIIMIAIMIIDPGIIPKLQLAKIGEEIPLNYQLAKKGRQGNTFPRKQYNFAIKTHYLCIKYCGICSVYRPPRTIHCYSCGVCIEKLDHHCPWLGMCIAKRNYRLYLAYIILMEVFSCMLSLQSIIFLIVRSFPDEKGEYLFNLLLLIISALTSIFVFTLIVVHFQLSKDNMTTNELHHHKWESSSGNPYQKSYFFENWINLFSKKYPSKLNLQKKIQKMQTEKQNVYTQTLQDFEINIQVKDEARNADKLAINHSPKVKQLITQREQ